MANGKFWTLALIGGMLTALPGARVATATPPASQVSTKPDDEAARQMIARLTADLSHEGPAAWLRYFDDDPGFLMAADGKIEFDGIAQARAFLLEFAKKIVRVDITWNDLRVDALEANVSLIAAAYSEVLIDAQGQALRPHGYLTAVAVRRADGWKFRSLHWSSAGVAP